LKWSVDRAARGRNGQDNFAKAVRYGIGGEVGIPIVVPIFVFGEISRVNFLSPEKLGVSGQQYKLDVNSFDFRIGVGYAF
jgi:hypothetical protein